MSAEAAMQAVPRADDVEIGILSCFLQDPENLLGDAEAALPVEAFYDIGRARVYQELIGLHASARKSIDLNTFSQHLRDLDVLGDGKLLPEGYIAGLLGTIATPGMYADYKAILLEKLLLRRIIGICQRGIESCRGYCEDVRGMASRIEAEFFDVVSSSASGTGGQIKTLHEAGMQWLDQMEEHQRNPMEIRGMQTGFPDYDRTTQGIDTKNGEIHVFAGRPGMGKTAFGVALIDHLGCEQNIPGAVWSMEMSNTQLLDRLILGRSGIDVSKANAGKLSRDESQLMRAKMDDLRHNVFLNDVSELTCADLRSQAQMLKRKHGIQWVMLDHLHLLNPSTKLGSENERMQLIEAMKTVQFIKKLGIGVIILVQMSQEADKNIGKLPVLADLPGSAAIGQFADNVSFLYRPVYYKPVNELKPGEWRMWHSRFSAKIDAARHLWATPEEDHFDLADQIMGGLKDEDRKNLGLESGDLARTIANYQEHTALYVRKNRCGPTPELWLRFEPHLMRFTSRTEKLYSNKLEERQPGYVSRPQAHQRKKEPSELDAALGDYGGGDVPEE